MPETPPIAGFLSYARLDDQVEDGRISRLRERLERAIQRVSGLRGFSLFQDIKGIGWGTDWRRRIEQALDGSYVLIPIITPAWFSSPVCFEEASAFLKRQALTPGAKLVLPLYYLESRLWEGQRQLDATAEHAALATTLRHLNFKDWRETRRLEEASRAYQDAIEELARLASNALHDAVEAAEVAAQPAPVVARPFDLDEMYRMILRGEAPPRAWVERITELDLQAEALRFDDERKRFPRPNLPYERLADLAPIASLANLQELYLDNTQVSDLAPIAGLAKLQWLDLNNTQVSDLAPIASLANLQELFLNNTQVSDLAPIASLAKLENVFVSRDQKAALAATLPPNRRHIVV